MSSSLQKRLLKDNPSLRKSFEKNEKKRNLASAMWSMRKKAGLTQAEIAERSGLSQSHVSKIEAATGPIPNTETLQKYAEACEADVWIEFRPKGSRPARNASRISMAVL